MIPTIIHIYIFKYISGTLETFTAFQKANAGFAETQGLSEAECLLNMRLLTFVSLVNDATDAVSYSQVAVSLNVELATVEQWVVEAKTKGLVDAKLDQLNQKIVINRSTGRAFDAEEWAGLAKKLGQWKSAVKTLLQEVQTAQEQSNSMPVM
jgi:transposase